MHASKCDYTCVHLTELQLADGACCCVCCIHVDEPWGVHASHEACEAIYVTSCW